MKKFRFQLALITLLQLSIFSSFTEAQFYPFTDISNSYARTEISLLHKQGIVMGDGKGRFYPNQPVTRAEFVTMLGRTLGIKPVNSPIQAFRDVPQRHWGNGWIHAGAQLGLIGGTSPSTFDPSRYISRQEAAAILVRSQKPRYIENADVAVSDAEEIADWAAPYVKEAIRSGYMSGYQGQFRPKSHMTRQEMAVVLNRLLSVPVANPGNKSKPIQLAWQYGGTSTDFIQNVQNSTVNVLSPRWFFLNDSGNITDNGDGALVKWAHQNGKQVWAMVGNRFDAALTHQAISQEAKRKAIINQIVSYSKKYQLDGVNIDFENVQPSDKNNYTSFIRELSAALKANHVILSIDVPPDLGNSWSAAYDYKALGSLVDYMVVMSYDEHWSGGPKAGSVASLPWFTQNLQKMTSAVPAKKVIAGIPLYTRDWYTMNGKVLSKDLLIPELYSLLAEKKPRMVWDSVKGQYIATYTKDGVKHSIWLEESRSISEKMRKVYELGISGAAYWHIGGGTTDVWTAIENIGKMENR
ncbi:S-layer homology domain-containing protein [Brevibacillus sp. H7]